MEPPQVDAIKSGLMGGCPRSYRELYDWLGPALARAARTMLRSASDAEDAVQEVFVNLVRWRDRLGDVRDMQAYVFTALRHAVAQHLARREAERRSIEQAARIGRKETCNPSSGADEELEQALEELPDEQREVIALKIDGGLTFAQIGAVLELSINTAASRYRYALEKLRQRLGAKRHDD